MSLDLCIVQDICPHFKIDSKVRTQHRRMTVPCDLYLSYKCEKMALIMELETWMYGEQHACNIEKVSKAKGKL